MSVAAEFFRAELPPPRVIMRMRMAPYSLGHQILLRATGNAFVDDEAEPGYADLVAGVLICSQPYAQAKASLSSFWLRVFMRLWGWSCGKFDVPKAMVDFRSYVRAGQWHPDINLTGDSQKPMTSPWEHRLKVWLMKDMGMTLDCALDYPLASAQLDYIVSGEMAGTIEPFSDHYARLFAMARNMKDEVERAE